MTTADTGPVQGHFLRRQSWMIQVAFGLSIAVLSAAALTGFWLGRVIIHEDHAVMEDSALLQQCDAVLFRLQEIHLGQHLLSDGRRSAPDPSEQILLRQDLDKLHRMAVRFPHWHTEVAEFNQALPSAPTSSFGPGQIAAIRINLLRLQQQIQAELGSRAQEQAERVSFLNEMLALLALASCASLAAAWSYAARRLRSEREVELALDRLRRRHALILNAIGEAICGIDRDGVITFANPAASTITGWNPDELLGRKLVDLLHIPHFNSIAPASAVLSSLREGKVERVSSEIFEQPDGGEIPIEFISTPIREEDQIIGGVVAFQDISDRLRIERMKGEFMAVVSHELRTPLTSLRGALGLLGSGRMGTIPEPGNRMLTIALDNADRLSRLVNDILDLERLNAGRFQLERKTNNLADVMTRAIDVVRPVADRAHVELQCAPADLQIWMDADRILQTLINLLGNAVKFSPPASTVRLEAKAQNSFVMVSVHDQGRGIPPDKLDSVFEKFEQVDASDSREKGGTGLGLPICRGIVQQHGGKIWVESLLGHGSTFSFTLPLLPELQVPASSPSQAAASAAASAAPASQPVAEGEPRSGGTGERQA